MRRREAIRTQAVERELELSDGRTTQLVRQRLERTQVFGCQAMRPGEGLSGPGHLPGVERGRGDDRVGLRSFAPGEVAEHLFSVASRRFVALLQAQALAEPQPDERQPRAYVLTRPERASQMRKRPIAIATARGRQTDNRVRARHLRLAGCGEERRTASPLCLAELPSVERTLRARERDVERLCARRLDRGEPRQHPGQGDERSAELE